MTMKRTADRVLLVLAGLFVVSLVSVRALGEPLWLLAVQALLEGALVGSIADWFAVKALFDAPLGIRFHTRLVPRNRASLLRAIADGVQNKVLAGRVIRSQVAETMLVQRMIAMIDSYGKERILAQIWDDYVEDVICGAWRADALMKRGKEYTLTSLLDEERASAISGRLLAMGSRMAESERFCTQVESYLDKLVEARAGGTLAKLFVFLGAASGAIDTQDASRAVSRAVSAYLARASEQKEDALRLRLTEEMRAVARRLDDVQLVRSILDGSQVQDQAEKILASLQAVVRSDGKDVFIREGVKCYRALIADERFCTELEAKLRWMLYRFVDARGYLIGQAIERTLDRYSEDEMRDFVESRVGDDLQWIRLNGAILGGILGLALFVILYLCGVVLN